jgi:hypothetical protein
MTHRIQFLRRHGLDTNKSYGLSALAKVSGVRRSHLQKVYNRGVGAYKTNLKSVRLKGSFKKNVLRKMLMHLLRLSYLKSNGLLLEFLRF